MRGGSRDSLLYGGYDTPLEILELAPGDVLGVGGLLAFVASDGGAGRVGGSHSKEFGVGG